MIDLAGLLAAGLLLVTLVALEVRHAGPNGAQPVNARVLGRTVNTKAVSAVTWVLVVVLLFPRVLELLT